MMVQAEGRLGRSRAVYGRTEIRNNRGGKQLAAKQVVKTSEARDVLLKDSRSKEARRGRREGGGKRGKRLGFIGHLLACGLQIYRCSAEEESAGGGKGQNTTAWRRCMSPVGAMRAVK